MCPLHGSVMKLNANVLELRGLRPLQKRFTFPSPQDTVSSPVKESNKEPCWNQTATLLSEPALNLEKF
jgi:hypothetical protein